MGLGQFGGGVATVRYLVEHGARVLVTDLRSRAELQASCDQLDGLPVAWRLGEHRTGDFETADLIVANPGVPPKNAYLTRAFFKRVPVTSEMELFLLETQANLLLVSGTHGKSSCVSFLHQLLSGWVGPLYLGGNLGLPLLAEAGAHASDAWCVVEISSYQLEALAPVHCLQKARGVGLTALASDHLERHGSRAKYWRAKSRLFELARAGAPARLPTAVWDTDPFPQARAQHGDLEWASYGTTGDLRCTPDAFELGSATIPAPKPWPLFGEFQRHNALLALALAQPAGLPADDAQAKLASLTSLPHRMRLVPKTGARRVIDNGVSTTPESTLAGLKALDPEAVVLIGGEAKSGLDYLSLARACERRGDRVFGFGAAAPMLAELWRQSGGAYQAHRTLAGALEAAWESTPSGATLLFSPACASFDAYPNFAARAREFLDWVANRCTAEKPAKMGD